MLYALVNDLSSITSEVILYDEKSITDFAIMMGAEPITEEDLNRLMNDDRNIFYDKRTI